MRRRSEEPRGGEACRQRSHASPCDNRTLSPHPLGPYRVPILPAVPRVRLALLVAVRDAIAVGAAEKQQEIRRPGGLVFSYVEAPDLLVSLPPINDSSCKLAGCA